MTSHKVVQRDRSLSESLTGSSLSWKANCAFLGPFTLPRLSLWNRSHSAWLARGPWELEARRLHEDRAGAGPRLGLCGLAITLESTTKCKVFVRLNKECLLGSGGTQHKCGAQTHMEAKH